MSRRRYDRDLSRNAKIGIGVGTLLVGAVVFFREKILGFFVGTANAAPGGSGPAASIELRTVTTHDPPPSGDLKVFDQPNGSQIGGAEKGSQVELLGSDGTFAHIRASNPGGRYAPVEGFVHAAFLS